MNFTTQVHKTCRKFYKNIYDFEKPITNDFIESLRVYGDISYNRFSELVPGAMDMFKIIQGNVEINGNIGGKTIFVVIPKENPELLKEFESKLSDFLK